MIDDKTRAKLREPLPDEAVSQHPTKTYLSSIKSIYVVERINDVFGLGSWTLKSEVIERVEKFVVVKAVLEIPEHSFYGEAYGGNDNNDIGDAYKGAVTDAFTKIAGQQLEIGIDVYKGLHTGKNPPPAKKPEPAAPPKKPTTISKESIAILAQTALDNGYAPSNVTAIIISEFKKPNVTKLNDKEASELKEILLEGKYKD